MPAKIVLALKDWGLLLACSAILEAGQTIARA
jgi:hypothetical protein